MKRRFKALLLGAALVFCVSLVLATSDAVAKAGAKNFAPSAASFDEDLTRMNTAAEFAGTFEAARANNTSTALKRLMVFVGYNELTTDCNAVDVATDGEYTVLAYATEEDTKAAYETLVKELGEGVVFYDHVVYALEDTATVESIEGEAYGDEDSCEAYAKIIGAEDFKNRMTSAEKKKKVIVAILDTGLNKSHEKIQGKYVSGKSYYNNGRTDDDNNHGTMCAGCVLGVTKGTNVKVMPVKVLNYNGSGSYATVVAGVKYAASQKVNVISMSLGGGCYKPCGCGLESAINNVVKNKKITVVVAAGNESSNIDHNWDGYGSNVQCHPANIKACITVSAIKKENVYTYFTNYGNNIDVCNYGYQIYMPTRFGKSSYGYASGTSFSCPFTSGAAALLIASGEAKTPSTIEKALRTGAKDLGKKGWDQYYGAGAVRLDSIPITCNTGFGLTKIEMKKGATKKNTFCNPGKKKVTFGSKDKTIATIDSKGTIKAKKKGMVVVYAKCSGKTYKMKVYVK